MTRARSPVIPKITSTSARGASFALTRIPPAPLTGGSSHELHARDESFLPRIDTFLDELLWMAETLRHGREHVSVGGAG
jgi:hypothetical protein